MSASPEPVQPAALPDGMEWDFHMAAARLLPALPESLADALDQYRDLFLERNQVTNLSAVRDREGIERRLIMESLRLYEPLHRLFPPDHSIRRHLLDIGSGGGLPGVVIALIRPDLDVTMVEATGRKISFLDDVIATLGITHARTIHARSEDVARNPRFRGAFDLATARAVASLPALIELGIPLVREGGYLVLPKGVEIDAELREGEIAAGLLGASIREAPILPDGDSSIATRLVLVKKIAPTPDLYPRRAGLPARNPLGHASLKRHPLRSGGRTV